MKMNRGYAWLNLRSVDDEKRVIEGIATTSNVARDGDVIVTEGIEYKLPLPFLFAHRHDQPFGNVVAAKSTKAGIEVRIQVAPSGVSESIDQHWREIKAGIVRGLSIGWRTLEESYDKTMGGFRILRSEWLELSAVTVPADANATITSVRSADEAILASFGKQNRESSDRAKPKLPGVPGQRQGSNMKKTFKKQIEELELEQRSLEEKMGELMEASEGGTLGEEDGNQYDEMQARCTAIEKDVERLRFHERKAESAKPIERKAIKDPASGAAARGHETVTTKQILPPGTLMARAVIALMRGGNRYMGAELADRHFRDTPQVGMYLRSIIEAGDTTTSGWASQLVPAARQLQDEFLSILQPATLLGRIPGLTNVPFNVAVPIETGTGSFAWVGEGKPTPVSKGDFSNATVRWAKTSGIVPITEELAKFSSPAAEGVIVRSMTKKCTIFLDGQFLSSSLAETVDHPGGILKDIGPETPSGSTAEAFNYDLSVLLASFTTANQDPSMAVLLISATTAMNLSLMRNALGQREFPEMTLKGGSVSGIPTIVSETVGDRVILVNASDILFADDGGIEIDISREASIEMDTEPIAGDASPIDGAKVTSFWQNHLVGIRVTRYVSWKRARVSAVAWLDNVTYAPTQPSSPE